MMHKGPRKIQFRTHCFLNWNSMVLDFCKMSPRTRHSYLQQNHWYLGKTLPIQITSLFIVQFWFEISAPFCSHDSMQNLYLTLRREFHISHDASLHTILSVQLGRDGWTTVESDLFCRWNLHLCCVDLFTIFVLLFQIYLLLRQRECFGRRLFGN